MNKKQDPQMGKLFQELKKRKVFTIAAVYAVVGWLIIQIVDVINAPPVLQ